MPSDPPLSVPTPSETNDPPDALRFVYESNQKAERERSVERWLGNILDAGLPSMRRTADLLRRFATRESGNAQDWLPNEAFAIARIAPAFRAMSLEFPWQRDRGSDDVLRLQAVAALDLAANTCGGVFLHDPQMRAILAEAALHWLRREIWVPRGAVPRVTDSAVHAAVIANNILALGELTVEILPGVENDRAALFEPSLKGLPHLSDRRGEALDYVVLHLAHQMIVAPSSVAPKHETRSEEPSAQIHPWLRLAARIGAGSAAVAGALALMLQSGGWGIFAGAMGIGALVAWRGMVRRRPTVPAQVPKFDPSAGSRQRWVQATLDSRAIDAVSELAARDVLASPEILLGHGPRQSGGEGARVNFVESADHLVHLLGSDMGLALVDRLLARLARWAAVAGRTSAPAEMAGLLETMLSRNASTQLWAVVARAAEDLRYRCVLATNDSVPDEAWGALVSSVPGHLGGEVNFSFVRLLAQLERYAAVIERHHEVVDRGAANFLRSVKRLGAWARLPPTDSELARALFQTRYLAELELHGVGLKPPTLTVAGRPPSSLRSELIQLERQLRP